MIETVRKVKKFGYRHNRPPKSTRVHPLPRDYYINGMAAAREWERFYSHSKAASSGASGSTHSCALGSVRPPGCAFMERESRPESGHRRRTKCSDHPPRERSVSPPPSKHTISQFPSPKSQVTQAKPDEYTIIPIVLASSPSFRSVAVTQTMSQSAEDIRTPTKSPQMQNKKTQTPESVLKSHKRLEWDPAADVGYCKRAMSMSNISTLERSILEDCGWRQPTEQRPEATLDGVHPHEAEESLNSRMESSVSSNKGDSRKKCKRKSRRQNFEVSSCQTDSHHPEREQQGIQKLTRDQRKAIPAQFEKIRGNRLHVNKGNQQPENPVVNPSTGVTASTSSTSLDIGSGSRPRGELDLGIDLVCSLVRSRSLSQGQKKKLVRDIARRISCLELTESSTSLRSLSISSKEQLKVPTGSLQQVAPTSTNHSSSKGSSKAERIALPVPAPRKRTVIGTSSPLPESLSYSGSTSGSGEVITQKTNVPTRAASTDADIEPLNLKDWLNPMTLSEIEFEERLKGGRDSERRRQLHWFKTEEYHLRKGMAAEAVEEMEISGTATTPPPPVRIESVGANSDPSALQAPPPTQPPPLPPEKMATPLLVSSSSTSGGARSESVCSFVHYQTEELEQFVLLQQQKLYQLQKQLNQQKDILIQRQQHCGQCAQCGHQRTCVHQQHCPKFQRRQQEAQDQQDEREQYMQMQYAQAAGSAYATPLQIGSSGADKNEDIYYQVLNSQGVATATNGAGGSAITTHQYDDVACQRVRRGHKETRMNAESMRPRAISYVIQFTPTGSSEVLGEMPSLQDQLQLARPEFCANAKQRNAILNEMQMIRNVRRQELDNVLNQSPSMEALNRHLDQLPPPAISRVRLFTTREMKAITSKRCKNLPEVLAAQSRQQEERRRRSNRLMRDVFNKSLKSRVASGKISLNHSVAII
ncbi:Alstrom syndrome protein 1 homolog a-like [Drosophila simulans]|uniref:Alstrom syndrome protein 1 homolog a-like n=1 Tax=Drosophila simulans TaxID=7240 RepID=UPI00192D1713|nr:Alstrom syndrome protein 1 homolog a-like [Drosophila simulans]